jgi:AraC-like DNA-binding protein
VACLKQHDAEVVEVEKWAARAAHMSPSTFRQHFRLQEARQLMLNDDLDASNASGRLGYESASQVSRKYCRLFGAPPATNDAATTQTLPASTQSAGLRAQSKPRELADHPRAL